jgi:hypothetical protein
LSLGDRIRRFFARKRSPELKELEPFVRERKGVEGFIEPKTRTNPASLLLVDRAGDHVRSPINEVEDAMAFCERMGIPIYDAQVVGYPKRMRDFDERRRRAPLPHDFDERFAELEERLREGPRENEEDA